MKLNTKSFSLAIMIFYGAIIFIFGIWHSFTGYGKEFIKTFESIHPSFTSLNYIENVSSGASFLKNIPAILINTVWAIVDGLIIGVCIAGLNNWFIKKEEKKQQTKTKKK